MQYLHFFSKYFIFSPIIDNKFKVMALYAWGSDQSYELGLGGRDDEESYNCPQKLQWDFSANIIQAALGSQVSSTIKKNIQNILITNQIPAHTIFNVKWKSLFLWK